MGSEDRPGDGRTEPGPVPVEPTGFSYGTAAAFRAALKDRFAVIAKASGRYTVDELQRQFAYDRALARLFSADDAERWVLKGAGALLARLENARHSKDIDLFYAEQSAEVEQAVSALRRALSRDLGDSFAFETIRVVTLQEDAKGSRVHLQARLSATLYTGFHIDVVVGTVMSGNPDVVAPLTPLQIEGLARPSYRAFLVADHLADKFCAMITSHSQAGAVNTSSRIKDLVDVALIAQSQELSAQALRRAVRAGTAHRNLVLPDRFVIPDEPAWRKGYPKVAADAPGPVADYDQACALGRGCSIPSSAA